MTKVDRWKWLVLSGLLLCGLGVLGLFYLARASLEGPTIGGFFDMLGFVSVPFVLIGVLATLAGSIIWARQARLPRLLLVGLLLVPAALAAMKFTPVNIHGWTFSLVFPYLATLTIGVLFLVFAAVRYALGKRSAS